MNILYKGKIYEISEKNQTHTQMIDFLKLNKIKYKEHTLIDYEFYNYKNILVEIIGKEAYKLLINISKYNKNLKFYNKYIMVESSDKIKTIKLNPKCYHYITQTIKKLKTKTIIKRYFVGIKKIFLDYEVIYKYQYLEVEIKYNKNNESVYFDNIKMKETTGNNKVIQKHKEEISEWKRNNPI